MRGRTKDRRKDIIKGRARIAGLSVNELAIKTGLSLSTLYRKLKTPNSITLGEIELIDELIHFTDEEILYFVRWRRCSK